MKNSELNNAVCCIYCDKIHSANTYYFWKDSEPVNYYFCATLGEPIFLEQVETEQRRIIRAYERNEYLKH